MATIISPYAPIHFFLLSQVETTCARRFYPGMDPCFYMVRYGLAEFDTINQNPRGRYVAITATADFIAFIALDAIMCSGAKSERMLH